MTLISANALITTIPKGKATCERHALFTTSHSILGCRHAITEARTLTRTQ